MPIIADMLLHSYVSGVPFREPSQFTGWAVLWCGMKFIIVQITNENDTLEAEISASDSGLQPSKPSYHLMLGPAPNGDIVQTPAELLRRIGFAVADQLKGTDGIIRREAEGAQSLMLALADGGQMVLRFDIGVSKADAMNALIDGGLAKQNTDNGKNDNGTVEEVSQ